jgi:NTE family protein
MGTEPVWKDHKSVLVSDGGAPFQFEASKTPLRRLGRYLGVVSNQCAALRKRWLIANLKAGTMDGAYWGINSGTASYRRDVPQAEFVDGYSERLVKDVIARVRTDMDHFTEAETAVLENHGYLLANAAVESYLCELASGARTPATQPQDWMDEARVRDALSDSHKRRLFRLRG